LSGGLGIGATFTATANGAISLDSVSPTSGQRVLLKNQTDQKQNGVYTVTTVGTGGTPFVLTRATDSDNSTANQVRSGDFVFINSDSATTSNGGQGWVMNTVGTGTGGTINIGTDNLNWVQFTGVSDATAGDGLTRTGNVISVGAGAGITVGASSVALDTAYVSKVYYSATDPDISITPAIGDMWIESDVDVVSTSAQISIGTVTTGAAGSSATVTNTGTGTNAVLAFSIPQGANGATGPAGATGATGATGAAGANAYNVPIITQATSRDIALTDLGDLIECTSASAMTLTVRADATVTGFTNGDQIMILQSGAGQVTIAGNGATINGTPGLKLRAQWSSATLIKRGTNLWVLVGDTSA
jgi:hypothetical protein